MAFKDTEDRYDRVVRDLNEERAAGLTRISRTLESNLAKLDQLRQRIAGTQGPSRETAVYEYRELRRLAVRYRWYLEVQREALGLRQHRSLDEFYLIPPRDPLDPPLQ